MKPILLFDIDGTLLNTKKSFMKSLFNDIVNRLKINAGHMKNSSFAGRTDRDIFTELVSRHPDSTQFFNEVKELYLKYMDTRFARDHADPVPGAVEAVYRAAEAGFKTGLCTGNSRESAFIKVNTAGLENLFAFGGFGCNHCDRNYLPGEAHQNFMDIYGYKPKPENYVVIGDTPRDIRCGKYFGAVSVAVATGGFSEMELNKYQPDILLKNLDDLEIALDRFLVIGNQ